LRWITYSCWHSLSEATLVM